MRAGSPVTSARPVRILEVLAVLTAGLLLLGACGDGEAPTTERTPREQTDAMGDAGEDQPPRFPPVFAYYEGEEVFFIDSETSNPEVSQMLTDMMGGSPVLVVDSLAEIPAGLLGTVYVFTNGIEPEDTPAGPMGFQPDVFDSAPGDEGYTPLRRIMVVSWADDAEPRLLTAEQEILDAQRAGEVTIGERGAVAVMPLLTWPEGQR